MKKTDGNGLRKLRKNVGLNQSDFWKRVGITQSAGSRFERGDRQPSKSLQLLMELAYGKNPQSALKRLRKGA